MSADFFHPTWDGARRGLSNANNNSSNTYAAAAAQYSAAESRMENWDQDWPRAATSNHVRAEAAVAFGEPGGVAAAVADPVGGLAAAGIVDPEDADEARDRNPLMDNSNYRAAVRAFVSWTLAHARNDSPSANDFPPRGRLQRLLDNHWLQPMLGQGSNLAAMSPASDVRLEVYCGASALPKSDDEEDQAAAEAVSIMHGHAERCQARLNSLLARTASNHRDGSTRKFDATVLQECLLDYWDEVFPATAGIGFYNGESPVPRMTRLHSFLTTPCPRALGTFQCEIERVKISSKAKGAKGVTKGMKSKFFPSYEYRLFIRDPENDTLYHAGRIEDSVLLVAKNKSDTSRKGGAVGGGSGGHRGSGGSGVGGLDFASAATPGSKRGVTNYYMCLPNQGDVDGHYRSANRNNPGVAMIAPGQNSGLAVSPIAARSTTAVEVGRLQSNFIGTEFQIFVPNESVLNARNLEDRAASGGAAVAEEGSSTGDSRAHIIEAAAPPAGTTTRRGSFQRRGSGLVHMARRASMSLSRRSSFGRNHNESPGGQPAEDAGPPRRGGGSKKAMRRMSWGGSSSDTRHRTNRRAIANNSESYDGDHLCSSISAVQNLAAVTYEAGEVENGAITYTANLLGNRPRIMDVCIPKLLEDGRVCDEWSGDRDGVPSAAAGGSTGGGGSNGHGSGSGSGTDTMLDLFKTIQQELENLEDPAALNNDNDDDVPAHNDDTSNGTSSTDAHGLMILQNRPPWWNIELGAFVLNFGGRVKVASVKNFQLCERHDRPHVMQFGRIEGRHNFTMDFQHPLTPIQAFAIAISSLQSKISFG